MDCKICNGQSRFLFKKKVLNKYNAQYFQCEECSFIQVKKPHWLSEAYEDVISPLDTGLVARNLNLSSLTKEVIKEHFNCYGRFVDYGGGYGLFVRLMRDGGFDFYRQDIYCPNLFAQFFDINDLKGSGEKFELLTAFELFEHLENPIDEIEKMLKLSDSILFSTELQPQNIASQEDWWYFAPESGQHISFYTRKSLDLIAERSRLNLYTDNKTIHLLTRKTIKPLPFEYGRSTLVQRIRERLSHLVLCKRNLAELESLTQRDHNLVRERLKRVMR